MRRFVLAGCVSGVLVCLGPVHADDLSIGFTLHGARSCVSGIFTGQREAPGDLTDLAGEPLECGDSERVWRMGGGLIIAVPVSSRFAVRIDPGFVSHGTQVYVRHQMTVRLDYLQLGAYGRISLTSGAVRPYLLAGVFGGHRLNDNADVETVGWVVSDIHNPLYVYRAEHWQGWNGGVGGGAGLELGMGRVRGLAEAIIERGLVDVYGGRNLDIHTNAIRFAIGLSFPIGNQSRPAD